MQPFGKLYGELKKYSKKLVLKMDGGLNFTVFLSFRYRALFSYEPINEDELRLEEGDEVLVLEKCDDGWFVGTSARTHSFGTFPGNYVEKITH